MYVNILPGGVIYYSSITNTTISINRALVSAQYVIDFIPILYLQQKRQKRLRTISHVIKEA